MFVSFSRKQSNISQAYSCMCVGLCLYLAISSICNSFIYLFIFKGKRTIGLVAIFKCIYFLFIYLFIYLLIYLFIHLFIFKVIHIRSNYNDFHIGCVARSVYLLRFKYSLEKVHVPQVFMQQKPSVTLITLSFFCSFTIAK